MSIYRVPTGTAEARITERGSRFIGWCAPADDESSAASMLKERIRLHHNATHHCWAMRTGDPASPTERTSDAGEPAGTAGRPILDQLRKADLIGAMLVVSRWFGGTKLGRGGLARAYGRCAAETIARLPVDAREPMTRLRVRCGYELIGLVEANAVRLNGGVVSGDYGTEARLTIEVPAGCETRLIARLREESGGKVEVIFESGKDG